jgi:hypothetical protein
MSNKSSVQWVIENLGRINALFYMKEIGTETYNRTYKEIVEKGDAMHKKEIEDSFNEGRYPSSVWTSTNAETYYNETYGGNK